MADRCRVRGVRRAAPERSPIRSGPSASVSSPLRGTPSTSRSRSPNELWRVDVAEGRPTVIPRLSDEEVDCLAAEWYENPPRGRLVERATGTSTGTVRPLIQ